MLAARRGAFISGASRGIGKGIALLLAENGYDVAITYSSSRDGAEQVRKTIGEEYGRECVVIKADLDQPGVAEAAVSEAISGLGSIELFVNNAGRTIRGSLLEMPPEDIDYLIGLNFRSYVLVAQTGARHMVEKGIRGSIISITSSRGTRAYPVDGVYGGLKSAIERATESFALDLAPYGIRVNAVAPGATEISDSEKARAHTKYIGSRIPLGRIGTPRDVAEAVLWLGSDKASYITGITLRVDGGLILPGMPESPRQASLPWGAPERS